MSGQQGGNGGRSSTMGESTQQRLAALVAAAKSSPGDGGAAGGGWPKTAGAYVGGFQGSLAGTWGTAATGRSGPRTSERANNPLLGGQAMRCDKCYGKLSSRQLYIMHPAVGKLPHSGYISVRLPLSFF